MKIRSQIKDESPQKEMKDEEPVLTGVLPTPLRLLGARQQLGMSDDGSKGWLILRRSVAYVSSKLSE
jgi:hypothetical protein